MLVTVVLRARSEELGHGALIGWVESTTTGVRVPVRNTWELLEALRSIAAGLGGVAILDAPGTVD